jgi:thioredoxin reductase (NADPH)
MVVPKQSIVEARWEQAFPVLEPTEIERMRRFGVVRSYNDGDVLAEAGKVIEGLTVVLSGTVDVTPRVDFGPR